MAPDDDRPRLNREWHEAHRLGRNPSGEERLAWHAEHVAVCACRQPPPRIEAELRSRGLLSDANRT